MTSQEPQVSKDAKANAIKVAEAEENIKKEVARLKTLLKRQSKNEVIRVAIGQMLQYSELQQAAQSIVMQNEDLLKRLAEYEKAEKYETKKEGK